jgi:hypothetical protein
MHLNTFIAGVELRYGSTGTVVLEVRKLGKLLADSEICTF